MYSSKKFISAGVPQGAVLGPLLFLIYINDISDDLTGMARLFADDTSLSLSSASMAEIEFVLNNDLEKLSNWANKWLIAFKAPVYLQDLLPDTVGATISYDLRTSANFEVPFKRLCSFETSFFPSTLKLWNELDLRIRSIPSNSQFKSSVRNLPPKPLNYLSAGERKFNIISTRLRHRSSSLNS